MPLFHFCNHTCFPGAVVVLVAGLLLGCSSRSAEEIAKDRAQVLGTWEYKAEGIRSLQRGTLHITERDGELVGQLRDRWRGQVEAEVDLRGTLMEIAMNQLRITGSLKRGRFIGSVQTEKWDVTRRSGRRRSRGRFVARRVSSDSPVDGSEEFGCASLLRESSYACSALGSQ